MVKLPPSKISTSNGLLRRRANCSELMPNYQVKWSWRIWKKIQSKILFQKDEEYESKKTE